MTEIYFSKLRLKLFTISTIVMGLFLVAGNLYFDVTRLIPIELKILLFMGQFYFTILLIIAMVVTLLWLIIRTAEKSCNGTFEIYGDGLKFDLGKKSRQIPWSFIKAIETSDEEWKFETKKRPFWIKFYYRHEKYKAASLLKDHPIGSLLIKC